MSHPGKFVSVNLNRSYGQPAPSHHGGGGPRPSRPSGGSGGGGGGGMVVLSRGGRGTSLAKPQPPKLSVPPPLNLPSLRKEHERFDGAAAAAGGGAASAPVRSGPPAAGWTKPAPAAAEKPPASSVPLPGTGPRPPSYGFSEKAVVLRGEDFPSLKAAVAPPPPPPAQRQKDAEGRLATPETRPIPLGMRPQVMPSRAAEPLASTGGTGAGAHLSADKAQRNDLGPLPLVRLRYDSDWADDERDTGLTLPERDSRERGFGRSEAMVPGRDHYGGMRDPFGKDLIASNKEGGQDTLWRSPMASQQDREQRDGRPYSGGRGSNAQSSYHESMNGVAAKDSWNTGREPAVRAYGQNGAESYGNARMGGTPAERYGDISNNWYKGNSFQNSFVSKAQSFTGNKGPLNNDPPAKFGREKRLTGTPVKPLIEDGGFDSITAVNLSAIKKKKEATKPADFHDPVRESFEAELDRILRLQEQEKQRVMEEQAKAREIVRKQEEERERLIREEEERQRLVEEEARHAAWLVEQERLEAAKRAEEQRIAREEEKRKAALEEERRKEGARKKLQELEARIARRQAESNTRDVNFASCINDELLPGALKDRDVPQSANTDDRHDFDRMGERINTSVPSESSSNNRFNGTVPRVHTLRDAQSSFADREYAHFSGRTSFQEQESAHYSPQRESFAARRGNYPKKDPYDGFATVTVRPSSRGRTNDSPWASEDYCHGRVPRWDAPRESDRFDIKQSDFDTEFFSSDRFGDAAWLPSSSHEGPNGHQGEKMFQSSENNDFPFARPRYSMRQPRVPPPPAVARSLIGSSTQHANSSFVENGLRESSIREEHTTRSEYGRVYQEESHQHGTSAEGSALDEQQSEDRENPILGSQSSLSVSSPPSSPPHVSHDEMDVSGDSPALPTSADGDRTVISDIDHAASTLDAANTSRINTSSTASHLEDDEWPSESNEDRQKQDEYDEESNSYQEDEINEGDEENLDLDDEFAEGHNAHVEKEPVILGFDEGVQVEIPPKPELELMPMNTHSGVMEQQVGSGSVCPSDFVTKAEKALQNLALDQINALTDETNAELSNSLVAPIPGSKLPQASSTDPIMPPVSAVSGRSEVPVTLQFGLFSGPSLIPTPPAIQIGSIQMPINLQNQINPSLSQVHPSPAPLFKFGQLRYVRPIAQNVQHVSQAMPSIHSSVPAPYVLNQYASNIPREAALSSSIEKSVVPEAEPPFMFQHSDSQMLSAPTMNQMVDVEGFHNLLDRSSLVENPSRASKPESHRNHDISLKRNYRPTSNNRESSQVNSDAKVVSAPKAPGAVPSGRGRKYGYAVKESNIRSTSSVVDHSNKDSRGFQRRSRRNIRRTEFRVRENVEKNHIQDESFSLSEQNEKSYPNGTAREISLRNANRREGDKSLRANEASDPSAGPSSTCANYYTKPDRSAQKAPSYERSHSGNRKSRAGATPEGDVNTSSQAGVACVVRQQGIEVPVDADGFIEVRSKRQIMSVRRELREKENRSKMRIAKAPRKQHQVSLHSSSSPNLNNGTVSLAEPSKKALDCVMAVEGRVIDPVESSISLKGGKASMAPIGPPLVNTESHKNYYAKKPIQSKPSSDVANSSAALKLVAGLPEENNKAISISTPFNMGTWDNSQLNQQVMPLTQTQLEEAMKPGKFEQAGSGFSLEANNALSPTIGSKKAFPSSASPINSLLAGEKIQFGAVTSPTVLPPVSRTTTSGLGPPGLSRPDMKIDRNLPGDSNSTANLFDKETATAKEPSPNSDDVEAEAAASAVAVAAISTDEVVGSGADAMAASASDKKSFGNKDLSGLTSGGQAGQSSTDEPLSVALPADLSVDTPSISMWHPLPSPQASGPLLSQFPGAQPSHFSCFEMNTMLGGQIFAFGPSDECAGSQGQQPQRSNALPSAPLGAWPQCHSGVESFYRPPTGFAGPFISPGGIPGVQGPPHMVVYNHFAPVGQFSQMGLGFMGTTYIPGDKQPDWKQNQGPSVVGVSQSDPNNQNMVPGQVSSPSVPTPVQHLRPTSIMPIPSPLTMFDIAPFQSSTDIQMQPCWPHMPVAPLHTVPLSVPLQQHPMDGTAAPQFVHNVQVDNKVSTNNRYQEPHSVSVVPNAENSKSFPNATAAQFTDELGLVEQPASSSSNAQTVQPSFVRAGMISNEVPNSAKVMGRSNTPNVNPGIATGVTSNSNGSQVANMPSKPHQSSSSSGQQYQHQVNNQDRRARVAQKTGAANEWQRRSGYQGRNQNSGSDKNLGTGRMKQIYVAKSLSASSHAPSG
uniref:BAT2 N-terminal domain-containing protein n=1 Tax=Leersia perrieri TaxID=77586 RepID=A0A0D9VUW1_9ORYZ